MELRHLRYFVALAERLNFTTTARFLGIQQPPLSIQIRNLEAELGGPLFFRERRRIQLTPLGLLLLDEARPFLQQAEDIDARIRDAVAGREGPVRIVHTQQALSERITKRLRKFIRKHRGTRLDFTPIGYENRPDAISASFDLMITESLAPPPNSIVLERARIMVAVGPKHRLAGQASVYATDLIGEQLFTPDTGMRSPSEDYVAEIVGKQSLAVHLVARKKSFADRLWHVSLGEGLAVCTEVDRPVFDAILIPLADAPEALTIALSSPSSRATALPGLLESIRE